MKFKGMRGEWGVTESQTGGRFYAFLREIKIVKPAGRYGLVGDNHFFIRRGPWRGETRGVSVSQCFSHKLVI